MYFKLLLFVSIISWEVLDGIDGTCDTIGKDYTLKEKLSPLIIGGYSYTAYFGKNFGNYGIDTDTNTKVDKYPFKQINPMIYLEGALFYIFTNKEEIKKCMKQNLTDVKMRKEATSLFMTKVCYSANKCDIIYMLYNDEQTILYATFIKIPEKLYFNLGKSLGKDMVYSKLPKTENSDTTFIYDVTGTSAKRIGCIKNPLQTNDLEMNRYKLSSFGGEHVWFRGPCDLKESSQALSQIKFSHLNSDLDVKIIFDVKYEEVSKTFICSSTPIIWYTGQYNAQLNLVGRMYEVTIEVYEPTEYGIEINEEVKIDSGIQYLPEIHLNIKSNSKLTDKLVYFQILEFEDSNIIPRPYEMKPKMIRKEFRCYGELKYCTINSNNITSEYDSSSLNHKVMAYFETVIETKRLRSKIFNVLWLLLENGTNFEDNFKNGQLCQSYLSNMKVLNNRECPITLNRAKTTSSTFEPVKIQYQNSECYMAYFNYKSTSGITCCYNSSSNLLITGAANFIDRNNIVDDKLQGSYRWKYLPNHQPHQHFLFDRLPMLSCCSDFDKTDQRKLNSKIYLCNKFWSHFHNITAVNNPLDYTGNLFGDPHIIGFSYSSIQYSYLMHGFFTLFQVKDVLKIIGLFYAGNSEIKTLLQYLVLEFNNKDLVEIIPINNKAGTLAWTILKRGKEVESLPFYENDFMISQSPNKTILSIYSTNSKYFAVKIDLTGQFLLEHPLAYMNFQLFVQVPNKKSNILLEGLFGTVNVTKGEIMLKENKESASILSSVPVSTKNDLIVNSWKNPKSVVKFILFFTPSEIEKFYLYVSDYQLNYSKNPECHGSIFCDIDKTAYQGVNIYQATLAVVTRRSEYAALERKSLIIPEYCPYPSFSDWIFDSIETSVGSVSKVIGCYDPWSRFDQSANITCTQSNETNEIPYWKVSVVDRTKVCIAIVTSTSIPSIRTTVNFSSSTTKSSNNQVYAAMGGAIAGILLIIVILVILVVCLFKDRFKKPENVESNANDNIAMDHIYDDFGNEYSAYSTVEKNRKF